MDQNSGLMLEYMAVEVPKNKKLKLEAEKLGMGLRKSLSGVFWPILLTSMLVI